jgi:fructoselysine 6-kinase
VLLTDELYTSVAGDGPVIDTLGAGDSFIARLLAGLLRGEPPRGLVQAASTYATLSCGELGAFGHRTPLPESLSLPPERHSVAQH